MGARQDDGIWFRKLAAGNTVIINCSNGIEDRDFFKGLMADPEKYWEGGISLISWQGTIGEKELIGVSKLNSTVHYAVPDPFLIHAPPAFQSMAREVAGIMTAGGLDCDFTVSSVHD